MWRTIRKALERLGLCVVLEWAPGDGTPPAEYMTRFYLTPKLRNGSRLYLHWFHRADLDRDPHDHPFDFWTMPLNQGYTEHVYDRAGECFRLITVPQGRWTWRPCDHIHRVTATDTGRWPLVTLVWRGPTKREWGYWVFDNHPRRTWIHQARYFANRAGFKPGTYPT